MFNARWKSPLPRLRRRARPGEQRLALTEATGLGWESSTEPKNKEDMIVLAKKLNPVVG